LYQVFRHKPKISPIPGGVKGKVHFINRHTAQVARFFTAPAEGLIAATANIINPWKHLASDT